METKKETALRSLGAVSKKQLRSLGTALDYVEVDGTRSLVTRRTYEPSMLVGISGESIVRNDQMASVRLGAPYVIDQWVTDNRRLAIMDVVALTKGSLLVVSYQHRDAVFAALPVLRRLSQETFALVQSASAPTDERVLRPTPTEDTRQSPLLNPAAQGR